MGKRFGRNQRRRAREQIQALEREVSKAKDLIEVRSREVTGLLVNMANVRDALGEAFIGLPPGRFDAAIADLGYMGQMRMSDPMLGSIQMLSTLSVGVNSHPSGQRHYWVNFGGEEVRYAMTEQALRDGPQAFITHQIADATAKMLVPLVRKSLQGRR